jgi:tetratricopeptide (TPR) repeat protein
LPTVAKSNALQISTNQKKMKTSKIQTLSLAALALISFSACNGLKKMQKKAETVEYTVTPNPLEMHGDSISVTVKGKYPAKYFGKKVALTINPKMKWNGGEKALKPITVYGEKAKDAKGTTVKYKEGGSFSYTDKIAYQPEMRNADLYYSATGQVKSKTKEMPEKKIADGTIVTPLLTQPDDMTLIGKDKFERVIPNSQMIEIFYLINSSQVRPTETTKKEMKDLKTWVENSMMNPTKYVYKGMSVSAYASPDGELSYNANLADDRAKSTIKYFQGMFKEKKTKFDAATQDNWYSIKTTAEDWEGFKSLMEQSSIADKDLILNVLKMYPDGEKREQEIKNLSKTYREVADNILPKLRRSVNNLNYDVVGRTDEQLLKFATTTPDSLNLEEILFAATLTNDLNTKLNIYKAAEKRFGNDWRTVNNVGTVLLQLNKLGDAEAQFNKADKMSPNNPVILNNLGIVSRWKGDRKAAMDYYKKAGTSAETKYNMGVCEILNGNYSNALSNMGSYKTFNSALATLLSGNNDGAVAILDGSKVKEEAISYYLKAIAGARKGDANMMINNLKTAINKDASLKEAAKTDMEFFKMRSNSEFKALVGM